MNKWEFDINELMNAFGHPTRNRPDDPPVSTSEMSLRKRLVEEEAKELVEAIDDGCLPDIAKEIVDVLVVTIGVARCYGMDLEPLWDLVHTSNMAKKDGPTDPVTGKKLKPPGWQKPDMKSELQRQGWLFEDDGTQK